MGMSPEEYRVHSLTHIPYHPGCKCCVAGRKRDHAHHRFKMGVDRMQAELEEANGASICADYFFPRTVREQRESPPWRCVTGSPTS